MTGAELKAWRTKHKLSQAAVGRLLHVTPTTVYRWEATKALDIPYVYGLCLTRMPAGTIAQQKKYGRQLAHRQS